MTLSATSVQSTMLALFVLLAPAFTAKRLNGALTGSSPAAVQTTAALAGVADKPGILSFTMPEIVVVAAPREAEMLPEAVVIARRLVPEVRPDTLLVAPAPVVEAGPRAAPAAGDPALFSEVAPLSTAEALRP